MCPSARHVELREYRRSLLEMKTAITHIEESNHTGDRDKYVYSTNTSRGSRLFLPDTRARPAARPIFWLIIVLSAFFFRFPGWSSRSLVLSDLSTLLLSAASPPGTVGTTSITWTKRPDFRQQWLSQKKTARKPEDILEDDLHFL